MGGKDTVNGMRKLDRRGKEIREEMKSGGRKPESVKK